MFEVWNLRDAGVFVGMNHVYEDAFNLLAGRQIASGMTRTVFECTVDKGLVVKVEQAEVRTHFQNLMEWFVWNRVCGTAFEKWFAPVVEISPDGRVLLMKRVEPIGATRLPKSVPVFFTDLKPSNFGVYQGRVVACDYGSHLLMEVGMTKRLKRADWGCV